MIGFGVLGAAKIAPRALIDPCADNHRASVISIAARDRARAERFAEKHGIPGVHDDYAGVIRDPDIQAVYNPLPISHHHRFTLKALSAGKHVLCEKSFAANAREAEEMARAARESGLVVMDAFHYRYHPVFRRAREVVASGRLGPVRSIEAAFHVPVKDPGDIRMNYETGGGVTMDIGCYPLSWVRHITGEEPEVLEAHAETGPPQVDVLLEARLRLPSGAEARISGDMRPDARVKMELHVEGELGKMTVENPLAPQMGHRIVLDIGGKASEEELDRRTSYAYQLDAFIAAVEDDEPLATDAEDAVKQMRLVDRCYEAAGLPLRGQNLST